MQVGGQDWWKGSRERHSRCPHLCLTIPSVQCAAFRWGSSAVHASRPRIRAAVRQQARNSSQPIRPSPSTPSGEARADFSSTIIFENYRQSSYLTLQISLCASNKANNTSCSQSAYQSNYSQIPPSLRLTQTLLQSRSTSARGLATTLPASRSLSSACRIALISIMSV